VSRPDFEFDDSLAFLEVDGLEEVSTEAFYDDRYQCQPMVLLLHLNIPFQAWSIRNQEPNHARRDVERGISFPLTDSFPLCYLPCFSALHHDRWGHSKVGMHSKVGPHGDGGCGVVEAVAVVWLAVGLTNWVNVASRRQINCWVGVL
jgi:hypothetical protein